MNLRCRPGDRAVVIAGEPVANIGTIVRVTVIDPRSNDEEAYWEYEGWLVNAFGERATAVADFCLQPIRGDSTEPTEVPSTVIVPSGQDREVPTCEETVRARGAGEPAIERCERRAGKLSRTGDTLRDCLGQAAQPGRKDRVSPGTPKDAGADRGMRPRTGRPAGLLQDDSQELFHWFASRPDARLRVREAAAEIARTREQSDRPEKSSTVLIAQYEDTEWISKLQMETATA